MLIGILATTGLAAALGQVKWSPDVYRLSDIAATAGKLDIHAAWKLGFVEIVFVFLFVDLFDNVGTLVGVGQKAGLFDAGTNRIPRLRRILFADAAATIGGSLAGTSTVVSYIESAAGVVAGGRSGGYRCYRSAVPGCVVRRRRWWVRFRWRPPPRRSSSSDL